MSGLFCLYHIGFVLVVAKKKRVSWFVETQRAHCKCKAQTANNVGIGARGHVGLIVIWAGG